MGQTELLELQELEFNLLGITARNRAGISMVKSVMSYLLDGVKATTDDLKKFSILHHHGNDRKVALSTGSECYDVMRRNSMTT